MQYAATSSLLQSFLSSVFLTIRDHNIIFTDK
jgi:hypothetical protein